MKKNGALYFILSSLGYILCLMLVIFIFRSLNLFDMGSKTIKEVVVESIIVGIISVFINQFITNRINRKKRVN